jgi:hypothetical protein
VRGAEHLVGLARRQAVAADMALVDLRGIGGHRAVDIHRQVRDAPLLLEQVQGVRQRLRTPNREGRHQDQAAARRGAADHLGNHGQRVDVPVASVAVGGLDDDGPRLWAPPATASADRLPGRGRRRIAPNRRPTRRARSPRRAGRPRAAGGRARRAAPRTSRRSRAGGTAQAPRPRPPRCTAAAPARAACSRAGWRARPPPPAGPRVRQQQAAQLPGGRRAQHLATKAQPDQTRDIAAVIEVGMREHDGVDRRRRHRKRLTVAKPQLLQSLEQPAIDQQAPPAVSQQVTRPGHRTRRPEEAQAHARSHDPRHASRLQHTRATTRTIGAPLAFLDDPPAPSRHAEPRSTGHRDGPG